ncbi:hypothetical protein [Desulfobulbus oligotrophicus]|uniref:Uncharacterized protein n=1 Tax=Desulfobulbus oligotrophicus TaxID=1909699 RepID=A0A7T5VEB4_9BACT|nr:hypothetical protein [Desulfobulbus oligotrophicus]QQG66236.1 hypothetical protein HP555_10380 [Desulfobulbus oligotrophicus]
MIRTTELKMYNPFKTDVYGDQLLHGALQEVLVGKNKTIPINGDGQEDRIKVQVADLSGVCQ